MNSPGSTTRWSIKNSSPRGWGEPKRLTRQRALIRSRSRMYPLHLWRPWRLAVPLSRVQVFHPVRAHSPGAMRILLSAFYSLFFIDKSVDRGSHTASRAFANTMIYIWRLLNIHDDICRYYMLLKMDLRGLWKYSATRPSTLAEKVLFPLPLHAATFVLSFIYTTKRCYILYIYIEHPFLSMMPGYSSIFHA